MSDKEKLVHQLFIGNARESLLMFLFNNFRISESEFYEMREPSRWGYIQNWANFNGYIVNVYCNASGYLYEIHRNSFNGGSHIHDGGYEADTDSGAWETIQDARLYATIKMVEIFNK